MGNPKYNLYNKEKAEAAVASHLRDLLQRRGTMHEKEEIDSLADFLGCTPTAIKQFRDGKSTPQPGNLVKIAQYYNISLDTLIGLTSPESPEIAVDEICRYTGLNRNAVLALHQMNTSTTIEEKRPLSFINRSLDDKHLASEEDGSETRVIGNILSLLDQYVTSFEVRRALDAEFKPTPSITPDEFAKTLRREEILRKTVTIETSDDMTELLHIAKLYREAKLTEIRTALDKLLEEAKKHEDT